ISAHPPKSGTRCTEARLPMCLCDLHRVLMRSLVTPRSTASLPASTRPGGRLAVYFVRTNLRVTPCDALVNTSTPVASGHHIIKRDDGLVGPRQAWRAGWTVQFQD